MDADAELGRNPVSKHHIPPEYGEEQADSGRGCRTRLREQILRRECGQEISDINVACSADDEQDWEPYPVDPYSTLAINICVTRHFRLSIEYICIPM